MSTDYISRDQLIPIKDQVKTIPGQKPKEEERKTPSGLYIPDLEETVSEDIDMNDTANFN